MRFHKYSMLITIAFLATPLAWTQAQFTPIQKPPKNLLQTAAAQIPHFDRNMAALAKFSKSAGTPLYAEFHKEFKTPRFMKGAMSPPSQLSPDAIALTFVKNHRAALKIGTGDEVQIANWVEDDLGFAHVRMRFFQGGLEIWPSEAMVHIDQTGVIRSFNGIYRATPALKTQPKLSETAALEAALAAADTPFSVQSESQLLIYDWHVDQPVLAYKVHLHPNVPAAYSEELFVDANTGAILNRINKVCTALPSTPEWRQTSAPDQPFESGLAEAAPNKVAVTATVFPTLDGGTQAQISAYNDGTGLFLVDTSKAMFPGQLDVNTLNGTIYVLDAQHQNMPQSVAQDPNGDGVFGDNADTHAAGAIAYQMSRTYDWLQANFNRNSYDGNGSSLRTYANFRSDPAMGLDNAYWNGRELIFGDGGQITANWAFALDFATHEICHAITSSSADLVYQFQSGALNESFSDMYAATQDDANWLLGETITLPAFGAPALRSLQNPSQGMTPGGNGWQPAHMNQYVNLQANVDNGGVHINSGITNHAYYQIATQIGRAQAIQIMHRALTMYLGRNSEFSDARAAAERSAADLYGENSQQQMAVSSAFANVGIGAPVTNPGETAASTLYYPMTMPFTNYQLTFVPLFYVASTSDQTITGTATWFSSNGTETFTTPFSLNPHATTFGTFEEGDQWVKIEADGPIIGAFQEMTADGTAWALMPATPLVGNGMFIPHIATDPRFWTVGAVANVRDTPSSVIYVDNLANGYTLDVNQVNHGTAFDFEAAVYGAIPNASAAGGLWGFFMNYDLNAEKVLEQNMVGAEIFGRKDVNQAAGLNMDATSGRNLLFTHVAADTASFWTGYSIVNLDSNTTSINILAFDDNGAVLANTIKTLGPFGKLLAVTGDASIPPGTSWFIVLGLSETAALSGMELFGTLNNQSIAGFQASPLVGERLYFPFVISGSSELPDVFTGLPATFTGISIVNPNNTTVNLTLNLYNNQGQVATINGTLDAGNKFLGTLSSLFGVSDFYGHVEVISTLPVSGFSLSGFLNGQELAANPAIFLE